MVRQTMHGRCYRCGDQELRVESDRFFRLGVPWIASVFQREIEYACPICGEVVQWHTSVTNAGNKLPGISPRPPTDNDAIERKRASVAQKFTTSGHFTSVSYPAVFRVGENVLFPTFEGNIQDATLIDRHGDPDLMADFAEEYLRQFWTLMPTGRLPGTLREVMPALLLLVTATELAVKAYWIRSDKPMKRKHSLRDLYEELEPEHQREIDRRFVNSAANLALLALGIDTPKVAEVMGMYSETYGAGSDVYTDTRYYAEPTTMLPKSSDLHGANLVKGNTPYPIFLPDVVRALIDTYRFYSGPERLRRLGADLRDDFRDRGKDNHGEWGLIPSSLGLVVVVVSQKAGKDAKYEDLKAFNNFKKSYPTGFSVDWNYGGSTLLFYHDTGQDFPDGRRVIDGLECRLWSKERLGMHPRDLNFLADVLECATKGEDRLGHLASTGGVEDR